MTYMICTTDITYANINGHEYQIKEGGYVKVVAPDHIPVLLKHGFVEARELPLEEEDEAKSSEEEEDFDIDTMDKQDLVDLILKLGGKASRAMNTAKLREIAKELVEQ